MQAKNIWINIANELNNTIYLFLIPDIPLKYFYFHREYLKQSHHIIGLEPDHITSHELDKGSHRRLDVDHRIMGSLEPLIEEEFMQFCEFRWLIGESSSLQLTVLSR